MLAQSGHIINKKIKNIILPRTPEMAASYLTRYLPLLIENMKFWSLLFTLHASAQAPTLVINQLLQKWWRREKRSQSNLYREPTTCPMVSPLLSVWNFKKCYEVDVILSWANQGSEIKNYVAQVCGRVKNQVKVYMMPELCVFYIVIRIILAFYYKSVILNY